MTEPGFLNEARLCYCASGGEGVHCLLGKDLGHAAVNLALLTKDDIAALYGVVAT